MAQLNLGPDQYRSLPRSVAPAVSAPQAQSREPIITRDGWINLIILVLSSIALAGVYQLIDGFVRLMGWR